MDGLVCFGVDFRISDFRNYSLPGSRRAGL